MKNISFRQIARVITGGCAVALLVSSSACSDFEKRLADQGKTFLVKRGYRPLDEGRFPFFSTCGKDLFARRFDVITPEGKRETRTLCYGPFGPYFPLFGNE
jgi:hypothetical protein